MTGPAAPLDRLRQRGLLPATRDDLALVALAGSLVALLHKSIGPVALVRGGAPAVYVTSLDVVLVVLVLGGGTGLRAEVRRVVRLPVVRLPLAGAAAALPSLLGAADLERAVAELVRMAWMFGLFVVVAARVRRPVQLRLLLTGLAAVAAAELVVVVVQWVTGGVLGLGALGVPAEQVERVADDGSYRRPFGTLVHPVVLGATLATLALVFAGVGLSAPSRAARRGCAVVVAVCVVPLAIAQARSALIGLVPAALVVAAAGRGPRLRPRGSHLVLAGVAAGAAALVASPVLGAQLERNIATDHLALEVESRTQLNDLALAMAASHPAVGVGLNNFEAVMGEHDRHGLIYDGYPVHNLYLLQLAETGLVGLAGLLGVGAGLLVAAVRLARGPDALAAGLGRGFAGVVVLFAVEELFAFSLRQDVPLALWWLLAGMVVAASAMSSPPLRRAAAWPRERHDTVAKRVAS